MSVKIIDNTAKVSQQTSFRSSIFLRMIAQDIVKESEPRTPKKKGYLRRDILISVLGQQGTIKWLKRYAAIQEGTQFRNYTTPGTGPHFAENAVKKLVKNTDIIAKRVF
jgi:predicted acylesterase/phospholipase RssA